jgi:hypothetical protein
MNIKSIGLCSRGVRQARLTLRALDFSGSKMNLRFLPLALFICVALSATPADAATVNPADFQVYEAPGQYTVVNNSSDWYVYALSVSNTVAYTGSSSVTLTGWISGLYYGDPGANFGWYYQNPTIVHGPYGVPYDLSETVAPGQTSSAFDFTSDLGGTLFRLDVIDAAGDRDYFFGNAIAGSVPEPSTWAMMILGFAGLGYMAYRRRNQASAFTPAY